MKYGFMIALIGITMFPINIVLLWMLGYMIEVAALSSALTMALFVFVGMIIVLWTIAIDEWKRK